MKKRFKTMTAIGLAVAMLAGNCATTWAGLTDVSAAETRVGNMSLVIEDGKIKEELCAEHIIIETYDNLLEYVSASKRIQAENSKYAPDSYDEEKEGAFISNCVIMKVNIDASLTADAEHIVAIIQNTRENSFYIQYDSEEAAKEAVKVLDATEGVKYAAQDARIIFDAPTPEPNKQPFKDVSEDDWFYEAVEALYAGKIMTGPNPNIFAPYEYIIRAQFAVILYRMEKEPEFETEKTFSDVDADSWCGKGILWAAENGVVTGYENGLYGTVDNITREQMAVMLYRYAKYKGYDVSGTADYSTFEDVDDIQVFAKDGLNWAVANGIIKGKDLDGDKVAERLEPQGSASRAEAAVMIQRFVEKYLK